VTSLLCLPHLNDGNWIGELSLNYCMLSIYIYKGHVPPIMGFQWYDNIIGMLNEAA